MKKFVLGCIVALSFASLAAIEINETELKGTGQDVDRIEFENYGGPYTVFQSADAIRAIGSSLGLQVASAPDEVAVYDPDGKYTLIHAVGGDGEDSGRLSADILQLNKSAGVDHIKNLRRIVAGFVEAAYSYRPEEADTIAVFITVYNAVYRGDMGTFSEKYAPVVTEQLSAAQAGLSTNWQDWAGGTQIVIPLGTDISGAPGGVDTSAISDDKVIEALRKEDNHALEARETLNGIKNREAGDAAQNAKDAQKDAAQKRAEGDKAGAEKSAQTAGEQQQLADRKRTEVQAENKALAADKREIAGQAPADESKILTGLFSVDNRGELFTLMAVDSSNGKIVRKSDLRQIRSPVVYAVDGMYLAICGEKKVKGGIRLCLIDRESLEITRQSESQLSEHAPLVQAPGGWYTIVEEKDACYAALFDSSLSLLYKSTVPLSPAAPFNQTEQGLLVSDQKGNPHLLAANDLSTIW